MFMALRQKAGIQLSKKQRLPSWGDAETLLLCPPSFLATGTAFSPCLCFLSPLCLPSQGVAPRTGPAALSSPLAFSFSGFLCALPRK